MNAYRKVRSVASSVVSLALALPVMGGYVAVPLAKAAAPTQTLLINELNWAGSTGNSADQWVELYNPATTAAGDVNFALHPYTLYSGATELVKLDTGVLPHGQYFLVSRLNPASTPSSLNAMPGMKPDMVDAGLQLSRTDLELVLKDHAGETVDVAGDGAEPLAGDDGMSGDMAVASMSRRAGTTDGTLAASWFAPRTTGKGFKPSAVQYGTPGAVNAEIAVPSNLDVKPLPANSLPTVTGTVVPQAGQKAAERVRIYFTNVATGFVTETASLVDASNGYAFAASVALGNGQYRITAVAEDAAVNPNRSAAVTVAIAGSPQGIYVVAPTAPVLAAPVLNDYPAYVTVPTVDLSGTVSAGTSAAFYVNGSYYGEAAIAAGDDTFAFTVNLVPNSVNKIEVRAKSATGSVSAPAIATVIHDTIAPKALDVTKVTVASNPAGTNDTVAGMDGAAEAETIVEFYADAALTTKIGQAAVDGDGAFAPTSIGDNAYATVYAVVRDKAGNASPAVALQNPVPFDGQAISIAVTVSDVTQTSAAISWLPVSGAASYKVKYKVAGGAYSSPVAIGSPTRLSGLKASTTYVVAVAAVDANGMESAYTEKSFTTLAPVTVNPAEYNGVGGDVPATPTGSTGTGNSSTGTGSPSTPTPTPTPEAAATPTPEATATPDEDGEVKSESTSSINWTPWIILAILVALAAIATAGYFYWFGGEDDDDTTAGGTPAAGGSTPPASEKSDEVTTKVTKKGGNQKRW